jgi:hypothetical protein
MAPAGFISIRAAAAAVAVAFEEARENQRQAVRYFERHSQILGVCKVLVGWTQSWRRMILGYGGLSQAPAVLRSEVLFILTRIWRQKKIHFQLVFYHFACVIPDHSYSFTKKK